MKYANGDVYYGRWGIGKKDGIGEMKYKKTGNLYNGLWVQDSLKDGEAIYSKTGDIFQGGFVKVANDDSKEFVANIKGIMKYANDDVYIGEWKVGKKHGNGEMKYANDDVYDGTWYHDNFMEGIMTFENGDEGKFFNVTGNEYKEFLPYRKGKMKYANGDAYDGELFIDKKDDFLEIVPHGQGKYTFPDGLVYEGEFEYGEFIGENDNTPAAASSVEQFYNLN